MRHGRFITTALVATAAMAIGPAWASAAPSPLMDDLQSDFAAAGPQTGTWAVEPGQVRLKLGTVAENFDTALPSGWAATPWTAGQTGPNVGGNAAVSGGQLTIDGARVSDANATPTFSAPQTLEFRAAFGADQFQNIGFGDTFDTGPWAMFSTGPNTTSTPGTFFARTNTAALNGTQTDTAIPVGATFDPTATNLYRIEWGTADVKFYVNGALVATHPVAIAAPMRAVASDLNRPADGGPTVKVDWVGMGAAPASGTFTSRVLSADSTHTVWSNLTGTSSGTAFETRTGNTATPDGSWSGFQAVGAGGAIQSPSGQYIQYRATLTGSAASLDSASLAYTVDNAAPSAAISSVDVSGTSASVSFSSPDSDIKGFECSLDGGAFAACASPKPFTGLAAGAHTVVVRPIDKAGNVGPTVSRSFSIASPQSGGGGGGGSAGGGNTQSSNVDKTAPKVTLVAKSLKASKKGAVSFTVGCPATEATCKVTLKLKNGAKTVASKTVTVKGGKTKTVTLQLNKATRQQLKHRSLKLSSVLSATDAAGNKKTTSKKVTLHRS
jgi:hypothetical protein